MLDATPHTRLDTDDAGPFQARDGFPCGGNAGWAVCYTQPQGERWAEANLARLGWPTYLPLATRWIKPHRHHIRVPLFPRYLFIHHDNRDLWRPIRETPGVMAVLNNGNRLQYVDAGALEAVRAAEALAASAPPKNGWAAPGVPCSLATGAFQGHDAVVLAVSRETATVAVMLFGALRQLTTPVAALIRRE